ncbi:MAG: hypothetical protein E7K72_04555 [Roseomonas mucosa]|uniref:DUF5666 domain-containing protein n=1 Tax=Roseomonas mucosa TaxID=207340 RepID=A0A1S8D5T4_9PROT|nr:hypothetical protein [Roseomonas mucosa]MDU7520661.1 hypothetical protein [Roseomonas mucosa]ONH83703.1 hypothetical protein APZ41_008200 [Roseomonas mucosa]
MPDSSRILPAVLAASLAVLPQAWPVPALAQGVAPGVAPGVAQPGTAPQAAPVRIRGSIVSVEGASMVVKTRDGDTLPVTLAGNLTVVSPRPVELSSIKPGDYLGIVGVPGEGATLEARAVQVFPEAMRGVGEGHYPWDLPGTSMTNATVDAAVSATSGRELTMAYKGQTLRIHVPPGTPVVTPVPATREDLKPGAAVMFGATRDAEGRLTATRVTVAKDGVSPSN